MVHKRPGETKAQARARKRAALFALQKGRCVYCRQPMQLIKGPHSKGLPVPKDMATFEHLNDRYSAERGIAPGFRVVLACWACNSERGEKRTAQRPLAELHQRSGHSPVED